MGDSWLIESGKRRVRISLRCTSAMNRATLRNLTSIDRHIVMALSIVILHHHWLAAKARKRSS